MFWINYKSSVGSKLMGYLLVWLLSIPSLYAANVTSAASGNWSATAWPNTNRTGTIAASSSSLNVTGNGTLFLTELSVGNILKTTGNVVIGTIAAINSNTSLTLTTNPSSNYTNISYRSQGVGPVDVVTINAGHDVVLDGTFTCASLTIGTTVGTTLFFNDNSELNCTGNLIMSFPSANGTNTIDVANGSLSVGGTTTLSANTNTTGRVTEILLGDGTITFTGAVSLNARNNRTTNAVLDCSGGAGTVTFSSAGNVFSAVNGIFTPGTATTFIYNNAGNQTVRPVTYNNLILAGGGVKTLTSVTVNGVLSRQGTATVTGTPTLGSSATLEYKGSAAQTTGNEFISPFPGSGGVRIENANGVTLGAARNLGAQPLTIGSVVPNSIFNDGGFQLTATGTLEIVSGQFRLGRTNAATVYPGFTTNTFASGTTVEYLSGVAQLVSTAPAYEQLIFSGNGVKTINAGTLVINKDWNTAGGNATLATNNVDVNLEGDLTGNGNLISGSGTISIKGNWLNSGSFTAGSGTVTYANTAGGQTIGGLSYNILNFENTSGVQNAAGNISAATFTTTAGGTIDMSTYTLTVTNVNHNGILITQNTSANPISADKDWQGDVLYNSAAAQTIVSGNYGLLNASGGNRTLSSTGTIGIADAFIPGNGNYTITGSTVDFNGSGAQLIPGFNFNNLAVSGNRAGAVITFINGGTIGVAGNFTVTATNVSYIIDGNSFDYNGNGAQTITAFTYHNLIVSNDGIKYIPASVTVNCQTIAIENDASIEINADGGGRLNVEEIF